MVQGFALPRFAGAVCRLAAVASLALVTPALAQQAPAASDAQPDSAKAEKAPKPAKVKKTKPAEKSWEEQKKADGVWAKRTNWLSFGAGYAKRTGDISGDGLGGYGIGYRHMMSRKYSFDAAISHDILGHLGAHYDIAVPFTVGLTRHFKWNTPLRPFFGMGGGYYYRKMYRTPPDYNSAPVSGFYAAVGANSPLESGHVLGFETRMSIVDGRDGVVNPVFGPAGKSETLWTIKLNWALAY